MAKWRIGEYVVHCRILDLPKISSILGTYDMGLSEDRQVVLSCLQSLMHCAGKSSKRVAV